MREMKRRFRNCVGSAGPYWRLCAWFSRPRFQTDGPESDPRQDSAPASENRTRTDRRQL